MNIITGNDLEKRIETRLMASDNKHIEIRHWSAIKTAA